MLVLILFGQMLLFPSGLYWQSFQKVWILSNSQMKRQYTDDFPLKNTLNFKLFFLFERILSILNYLLSKTKGGNHN